MVAPGGHGMTVAGSLNATQRAADMRALAAEQFDVLVIGGGITGVGVALDAASRGLRTGLVERADLANGTSRWSSKLIHGGLRYLPRGQVGVAWESARERHILLTVTAPHLVRPLPFLIPFNDVMPPAQAAFAEAGVRAGDLLRIASGTRRRHLPGPRRITALEAVRLFPSLRAHDLRSALLFWDGQVEDDARLVIAVARTAVARGAALATHCRALSVATDSVYVRDELSGATFTVRARTVVNATGVWADTLDPAARLRPSKGSHLVVEAAALGDPRAAVVVLVEGARARWVGATPVGDGRVIVGVTDDPHHGAIVDDPSVTDAEEHFLLTTLSRGLRRPVGPDDVIGRFAGYRPLLDAATGSTADLSRRHAILQSRDGALLTLVGGKLTTYRRMAQDVVDVVVARRGGPPSVTATLPLVGAGPVPGAATQPDRLVRRYGSDAAAVAALAARDATLLEPVAAGSPVLGVELLFGILHEGAMNLDDLLDRRVRLGLVPEERRRAAAAATRLLQSAAA